jgi:Phage integrase, N-terminal SAM-like domain
VREKHQADNALVSCSDDVPVMGMAATLGPVGIRPETSSLEGVPDLVRCAGERAVIAYQKFFTDATWTPGTRRVYGQHIRRFCRWVEDRGLTLETIDSGDLAEFIGQFSPSTAAIVRSVLCALFRYMVAAGVLTANAFPPVRAGIRRAVHGFVDRLATLKSMRSEVIAEQTRLDDELAIVNELISMHENGVAEEVSAS